MVTNEKNGQNPISEAELDRIMKASHAMELQEQAMIEELDKIEQLASIVERQDAELEEILSAVDEIEMREISEQSDFEAAVSAMEMQELQEQDKLEKLLNCVNTGYEKISDGLVVRKDSSNKWGVDSINGYNVVPFGKYAWIDGYDSGFARVYVLDEQGHKKWGIIDTGGNIVVKTEFDEIWNFYRKNRTTTKMKKNGVEWTFDLLKSEAYIATSHTYVHRYSTFERETRHYEEFAGTYAQDVMGYSDEDIYDAFDGEPDAYWNID